MTALESCGSICLRMSATATTPEQQEALALRESAFAVPREGVEFPTDLVEARVERLVTSGKDPEDAKTIEEAERAKLVPLHIIRPGIGKGKGRHLYEAKMLEENAGKFTDWKMFVDHLSPEGRKAAGGLPRSLRDLGGRIVESYWDGSVPADSKTGHGQGAVIGWAIPSPFVKELIDNDPLIVEASISANATAVQSRDVGGKRAWVVEGIEDRGSVDWVTEAGAGGRVVALMEAAYEEETLLMESMTDQELLAWVQEHRPHLVEGAEDDTTSGAAAPKEGEGDGKTGAAAASKAEAETKGETMGEITPDALREALQSEEFKGVLDEAVSEKAKGLVEAAVSEERELIRAEARADADRQIDLRDLRDEAHTQINETKLSDAFKAKLRNEFALTESGPTPALDAIRNEVDDEGKTTKSAHAVLTEAVEARIEEARDLLASANPTRVRGQGPAAPADGEKAKKGEGTLWGSVLQEAGVDPEKAWATA